MLFTTFKTSVAVAAKATPNFWLPKITNYLTRGRISVQDAAELYLAARFAFALALITLLSKSYMFICIVSFIQITSLIYLLKIIFPVEGPGLTDPNRSLFFALGHYIEIGLSMAYVYWVFNPFGASEITRISALYFSFVTMTTIGFGDFAPQTDAGRILVVAHALTGLFMLATVVGMFLSLAAASKSESAH